MIVFTLANSIRVWVSGPVEELFCWHPYLLYFVILASVMLHHQNQVRQKRMTPEVGYAIGGTRSHVQRHISL